MIIYVYTKIRNPDEFNPSRILRMRKGGGVDDTVVIARVCLSSLVSI